jgi:hypothetical protein
LDIIGGSYSTWDNTHHSFIAINGDELKYENPTPASGGGTAIVILKRASPGSRRKLDDLGRNP